LADVVAVAEGLPLVELLAEENVNAPPPEHAVALSAEILKLPVTPKLVRVPFVISENIRSVNPEPVGNDGLPDAQEGVRIITSFVILMPGANIPCAVSKFGMG